MFALYSFYENIQVDTEIAGLRRSQAELYEFEENSKMASKMVS